MRACLLTLLASLFVNGEQSHCSAGENKSCGVEVVALGDDNFDARVLQGDEVWAVLFTNSAADHEASAAFAPTWQEFAASLRRIRLGVCDVSTGGGRMLAAKLGLLRDGVPAVVLYAAPAVTESAALMPGGSSGDFGEGLPSFRELRRALKKKMVGLQQNGSGRFLKRGVGGVEPTARPSTVVDSEGAGAAPDGDGGDALPAAEMSEQERLEAELVAEAIAESRGARDGVGLREEWERPHEHLNLNVY